MDSEFTGEKRKRLIEIILQAMNEGWTPASNRANDGAWTNKQSEARFAAAFKELVERDPNNTAIVVGITRTIQ